MESACYFESIDASTITDTLRHWRATWPQGVCLAFVAEADRGDIPQLQAASQSSNYPLLGAVFPELIAYARFKKQGVLLLCARHCPHYQIIDACEYTANGAGPGLGDFLAGVESHLATHPADNSVMLLFDCLAPNINAILDTVYDRLGQGVHYLGANAGSESFQPMPCLFDHQQSYSRHLLAIHLSGHRGALLAHNYHQPEAELIATATTGNRIHTINGKTAFEVYQELVETHYGVIITVENFYEYGVHFPFGLIRDQGEPLVRIPVGVDADGSLYCVGDIPPHAGLSLLKALPPGSLNTVDALSNAPQLYSGELVLNFYCAGRRLHMQNEAHTELRILGERLRPLNVMGALSLGEIGRGTTTGRPEFQNAALITAPW